MAKSTAQKEAVDLWRREQQEEEWAEESRSRAMYLVKYLRDVGYTKNAEAESKLNEIRKLADELFDLLENVNVDLPDTAAQDSTSKTNNPAVSG